MVHDHSKVCGWLLYLQQPEHRGEKAVADGCVFAASRLQPLRPEAKVGAVQQCMRIHQDQPACNNAWDYSASKASYSKQSRTKRESSLVKPAGEALNMLSSVVKSQMPVQDWADDALYRGALGCWKRRTACCNCSPERAMSPEKCWPRTGYTACCLVQYHVAG